MPLHVLSTVVLIIRRSNCIIQHLVSSHSVGGCAVPCFIISIIFLYMFRELLCSKHVEEYNKLIIKQEFVH